MQTSYLIFLLTLSSATNAACPSFNINYPPMRTLLCPGDIITYTCALSSSSIITIALWTGSGFQCTGSPVNSTIILTQLALSPLNTVPVSCGSLSAVITNISGTCYTTVLTIPTPQYFNGTTVTCRDGIVGTLIGSDTLQVQLAIPPNTPAITSVISNYSDQLTVTWASVPTATSYNVSINGSTPISLPANASIYSFTGLAINTAYNLLVLAINCAGSSNPTAITGTTGNESSTTTSLSSAVVEVISSSLSIITLPSSVGTTPSPLSIATLASSIGTTPSPLSTTILASSIGTTPSPLSTTILASSFGTTPSPLSIATLASSIGTTPSPLSTATLASSIGTTPSPLSTTILASSVGTTPSPLSTTILASSVGTTPSPLSTTILASSVGTTPSPLSTTIPPAIVGATSTTLHTVYVTTTLSTTVSSDTCTAAAVGSFGTAVGVSISVTFVVSFSMGVLMASVLCYIPRRSHKASSHSNPATTYDEVITNKKVAGDVMEMNSNTAEIH
ncbi:hypothetical protein EMCRGX_G014346 [Ephydatia muelleri]